MSRSCDVEYSWAEGILNADFELEVIVPMFLALYPVALLGSTNLEESAVTDALTC